MIAFIIGTVSGAVLGFLAFTLYDHLGKRRDFAKSKAQRELADQAFTENAIAKAEDLRGAASRLPHTVDGAVAWAIAAPTIRNAGDFAAAAIAYGLADSPPAAAVNVDRLGLQFALWWYGLEPGRSPHPDLNGAWRRSGDADPIRPEAGDDSRAAISPPPG